MSPFGFMMTLCAVWIISASFALTKVISGTHIISFGGIERVIFPKLALNFSL